MPVRLVGDEERGGGAGGVREREPGMDDAADWTDDGCRAAASDPAMIALARPSTDDAVATGFLSGDADPPVGWATSVEAARRGGANGGGPRLLNDAARGGVSRSFVNERLLALAALDSRTRGFGGVGRAMTSSSSFSLCREIRCCGSDVPVDDLSSFPMLSTDAGLPCAVAGCGFGFAIGMGFDCCCCGSGLVSSVFGLGFGCGSG